MARIDKIFTPTPDTEGLDIREELYGIHALNPFAQYNSSARLAMMTSHISQMLPLENGEEPIIQTGLEKQLGENTWSVKIPNDARIVQIISRYGGIGVNTVNSITEILIVYEDLETLELDFISVPHRFDLHPNYGFKYRWNTDILNNLRPGSIINKNTILADSPNVKEGGGYGYGINANVALLTIPEVAEDGMVISETMSKKLKHTTFEKIVVEYGVNSILLNLYGDETNYRPFPEIGESIKDHSIVIGLRRIDPKLAPALLSVKDTMDYDPMFDRCYYAKYPNGIVSDIKVYHSPKFKKNLLDGTSEIPLKYANALTNYYKKIIEVYEDAQKEYYRRYKSWDMKTSEKLSRLLVEAYALTNVNNDNIKRTFKKDELDIIRVEITVMHEKKVVIGNKISDLFGGKGIVTAIFPDNKMPKDPHGNPADVIADPTSIFSRMNIGKLYWMYFGGVSRKVKNVVIDKIYELEPNVAPDVAIESIAEEEVNSLYNYVLGCIGIIGTEQFDYYRNITDINIRIMILKEIINKEFYIKFSVSSKKLAYQVVGELRDSIYAPTLVPVSFEYNGEIRKTKPILIAPLYIILLNKTADNFLSTASAKLNHFNVPCSISKADKAVTPWRDSPTKTWSETELRLMAAYGSRKAAAEFMNRASDINAHRYLYSHLLNADKPTNIANIINRDIVPYGGEAALKLINTIFNCSGITTEYVEEELD